MMKLYYLNIEKLDENIHLSLKTYAEPYRAARAERAKNALAAKEAVGTDALLKIALSNELRISPLDVRCGYRAGGEPYVIGYDVSISISHSCGCILLALSRSKIGADIELLRVIDVNRLSARYFTEGEKALLASSADKMRTFFSVWTAKEAYFKYSNQSFRSPLSVDTAREKAPLTLEYDGCIISAVGEDEYEFVEVTEREVKDLLDKLS